MRNQSEIITLDSFHLQLEQLIEKQQQFAKGFKSKELPFYFKLEAMPISISRAASISYFIILPLFLWQTLDVYLTAFSVVYTNAGPLIFQMSEYMQPYDFLGYYFSPFLIALVIITFVFNKQNQQKGFIQLFNQIGLKVYPYIRYLVQLNLTLSAYFALDSQTGSIVLFLVAAFLSLFTTILMQNFTLRKDQFCCKSIQLSIILRLCILCAFSINIFGFSGVSNQSNFLLFAILHLINSTFLILSYYYLGITIYRHIVPRYMTFILIISYSVLSISMFYDLLLVILQGITQTLIYAIFPVSLALMIFFNLSTIDRIRRNSNDTQNKNLKEKIYFLFNKFQNAHQDQEIDCEIRGILFHHKEERCLNTQCYVNQKQIYDPKKKNFCSITKIGQSKVSLIKFYAKCLLENAIQNDKQSTSLLLDFVQFYYLKLKNVFLVTKLIAQLEQKYLSFFQKIRLHRLKLIIKQQCNGFSEELYLKALSMQNVLQSQEQFSQIQQEIEIVLLRNELFWKYIERNEVNLSDILSIILPNFELTNKINQQWSKISHYFDINRAWKFYYLCFTVYVKNQKLLPTMIQDFGNSVEYDTIFKTGNHFIDKTTQKNQLYNSIMLFQKNTCFVHTLCDEEKMTITKVSKYFSRNFDYDPQDIINSPIHVLMPPTVKKIHHSAFIRWLKEGRCSNEQYYSVKKIYPMTKKGFINPSFKFYKYYLKLNGETQYIAMFKRNRQDELIILTNADFQIQAITQSLSQKFKLGKGDYNYLKGLNLLAIMPLIIKYTRFGNLLTEKDQDFVDNDDNRNYLRKQSTHLKENNPQQNIEMFDILHLKETLNLVNVKVFLPSDLQAALQHYNSLINVSKLDTYRAIKDLYNYIRKAKNFSKFKAQISIHERVMMKQIFYEIEINEIQENNRLQKIIQAESQQAISAGSISNIGDNRLSNIDLQLFFHTSKKKNKVVLFPSNNIFIKDQNNKALQQISHIKNINISIRISLILFLIITLSQLIVDLVIGGKIKLLSSQYYWISQHQKVNYILNTQYNLQHMQLSNGMVQSYFIVQYTHQLIKIMETPDFLLLIFDQTKNIQNLNNPYFHPYPSSLMTNVTCPELDQFQIFFKMFESAITLHRKAEVNQKDHLQYRQYCEFNNYIDSYYNKTDSIKKLMVQKFEDAYNTLQQMMTILGITQAFLIIVCFIFILTRLLNVSRGFTELVGIFVQMDNLDIRKIFRFTQFVIGLFGRLNDKHEKISTQSEFASQSITKDNQKHSSSEMSFTDEQFQLSVNANLNKKIKKINFGNQISKIRLTSLLLIIFFLLFVVAGLLSFNVYAMLSLSNYKVIQEQGYFMMKDSTVINVLVTGMMQKFRNASIYSPEKYLYFLNTFANEQSQTSDLSIASGDLEFQKLYKQIYYKNFCQQLPYIIEQVTAQQMASACSSTNIVNPARCAFLSKTLSVSGRINRCITIQNSQLKKGVNNYYNYLYDNLFQFFNDRGNFTSNDISEINSAQILIDMFDHRLMETWKIQANGLLTTRQTDIIIIVICIVFFLLVLHIVFVEYLISRNLVSSYEIFRKMHEHLIPEFVINKQKIIKAKLIKEGFMKE